MPPVRNSTALAAGVGPDMGLLDLLSLHRGIQNDNDRLLESLLLTSARELLLIMEQ